MLVRSLARGWRDEESGNVGVDQMLLLRNFDNELLEVLDDEPKYNTGEDLQEEFGVLSCELLG